MHQNQREGCLKKLPVPASTCKDAHSDRPVGVPNGFSIFFLISPGDANVHVGLSTAVLKVLECDCGLPTGATK